MQQAAASLDRAFGFTSETRSHPGRRRAVNEDRVLARADRGLWAVADGMGGLKGGDLAATRLMEALDAVPPSVSGYSRLMDVTGAVERVNADLFGEASGGAPASGSTLVLLLAHEGHYACLWAGDSRAYRLRGGRLLAMTHDHSLVQGFVDTGVVSEAERRSHPLSNVVTRAVGTSPTVRLEQSYAPIEDGDVFLLCSDGLTGCVSDAEIEAVLTTSPQADAADRLLETALARHAPDNVSLVLIETLSARTHPSR